jgi:hypothetical protein
METKDLIGLSVLFGATLISVGLCCLSHRVRDVAFFLLTATPAIAYKLDINFFSHFWYRGTTRGVELTLIDALAVGVLIGSLVRPRPGESHFYWPASLGLMLTFFGCACFSVIISEPKIYGLFELSKMFRGFLFFLAAALFVRSERELAILVFALCCAVCFEGVWVLKQRVLEGLYRVPGTLDDPNSLSMYLCTVSAIFVAAFNSPLPKFIRWASVAAIAAAAVSIVLTISRAGIPIFALVMLGTAVWCVSWRITFKKVAVVALIGVCVAGLVFKSWDILKARYMQSSLAEEYLDEHAYESRGYFLRLAREIVDDRFLGVGLNNWSYWVSKKYGALLGTPYEDYDDLDYTPSKEILSSISYAAPAHNLAALTVGEMGVPGLLIFALLWLRWFQMGASFLWKRIPTAMHRLGVGLFFCVCGIFLQSITEWVFRQTHIFLTFHVLVGALASLYRVKRQAKREWAETPVASEESHYEFAGAAARS